MTSIAIPESVTRIGMDNISDCFYNCTNLTDVYYAGSEDQWHNIMFGGEGTLGWASGYGDHTFLYDKVHFNSTLPDEPVTPPVEDDKPVTPPTEDDKPITPPTEETEPSVPPTEGDEPTTPPIEDNEPIENPFVDVPTEQYYHAPVLWAVEKGITTGVSETSFAPDATCTRAQIITFLWRANGSPASSSNPFTDVPAGQWYTDAVLWAVEKGITNGTSASTFAPDQTCTRGQIVTFLWRYQHSPSAPATNSFTDVPVGQYYSTAVAWAVANGITNGMGEGLFAPDATCTRGQIVTFLYRAMTE